MTAYRTRKGDVTEPVRIRDLLAATAAVEAAG